MGGITRMPGEEIRIVRVNTYSSQLYDIRDYISLD